MKAKRILAFLIAMIMMIGLLPAFAFAEGEADPEQTDEPEIITEADEEQDEEEPEAPATVEEGEKQDEEEPEAPATVEEGEKQDEEEPEAPATKGEEGEKDGDVIPVESVTLDKTEAFIRIINTTDPSVQLTATVYPENATDKTVTWTSDNDTVLVDANGLVTIKGWAEKEANITATAGDKSATCHVRVIWGVYAVNLSHQDHILLDVNDEENNTYQLTPTVSRSEAAATVVYTWTSNNPAVATVDENGLVTAVSGGLARITVKATDLSGTSATYYSEVTVKPIGTISTTQNDYAMWMREGDVLTIGKSLDASEADDCGRFSLTRSYKTIGFNTCNIPWMVTFYPTPGDNPITKVVIKDEIKPKNLNYWFAYLKHLTTFEGLENIKNDRLTKVERTFMGCTGLEYFPIEQLHTENCASIALLFEGCSGLKSFDFAGLHTDSATSLAGLLLGCKSLTEIDLSKLVLHQDGVKLGELLQNCTGLTEVDLNAFQYSSKVSSIDHMLAGCTGLTSVDFSGWDTSNVTRMGYLFASCTALNTINFGANFNTSKVTSMYYMFNNCSSLTSVDVSMFNTDQVTTMENMFAGCTSLEVLDLTNFNATRRCSSSRMFSGCSSLHTIYWADWSADRANNAQNSVFSNCTSLVGGMGTKYNKNYVNAQYAHIDRGTTNPGYFTNKADVLIAGEDEAVWVIRNNTLFIGTKLVKTDATAYGKVSLVTAYAQNGLPWEEYKAGVQKLEIVDVINPVNMQYWFYGFANMTTVTNFWNVNDDRLVSLYYTFGNCSSLTKLDYYQTSGGSACFEAEKVTTLSHMFDGCTSLTEAEMTYLYLAEAQDLSYMFKNCSSLTYVAFDYLGDAKDNLTTMEGMLYGCSALTTVHPPFPNPDNVNIFPFPGNVTNFSYLFYGCSSLTELDLTNMITTNATNMDSMFEGCSNLEKIKANDWAIANDDPSCGENMFLGCVKLEGGSGALYDAAHVDNTYAHLDHPDNHGYFWNVYVEEEFDLSIPEGGYIVVGKSAIVSGRYHVVGETWWQTVPLYSLSVIASNPRGCVTVENTRVVKGVQPGKATIKGTYTSELGTALVAEAEVTVVGDIELDPAECILAPGEQKILVLKDARTHEAIPGIALSLGLKVTSSRSDVKVTVDRAGVITVTVDEDADVNASPATITATWKGLSATCTVNVQNPVELPKFKGHSLLLTGQIGVQFFMILPGGIEAWPGSYMTFEGNPKAINNETQYSNPTLIDGRYGYTVNVSSIAMAEKLKPTFHFMLNGTEMTITDDAYAAEDYISRHYAANDLPESYMQIVRALADYGYYSQQYLSVQNGWVIGEDYAAFRTIHTQKFDYDKVCKALEPYAEKTDITNFRSAVTFGAFTDLLMAFPYNGTDEVLLDGAETTLGTSGDYTTVTVSGIYASELLNAHTLKVGEGTATNVSPMSYAYKGLSSSSNAKLKDLLCAFYNYGAACGAFGN